MLVRSGAVDVVAVDSVAALTPRAELEGQMGDQTVGVQARMMSQAMRKLAGNLNRTQTLCLFVNQIREKVGVMFGSPETQPGGRALKFYSSQRLDIRRIETLKDGTEAVGNRVRVKVVKNKVAAPFRQAEFDIEFGKGISSSGCILDLGIEHNIVTKSGSFFSYGGDRLGQGRNNAKIYLDEHPEVAKEIEGKVYEALGLGQDLVAPIERDAEAVVPDVAEVAAAGAAALCGGAGRHDGTAGGSRGAPAARARRRVEGAQPARAHRRRAGAAAGRQARRAGGDRDGAGELLEQGYLDDASYAQRFADDRRRLDAWGAERIERRLLSLGIDRELIAAAVGEQDHAGEIDAALELLARRFPEPPQTPRERDRALGMLVRKGYELELAYDALRRHCGARAESFDYARSRARGALAVSLRRRARGTTIRQSDRPGRTWLENTSKSSLSSSGTCRFRRDGDPRHLLRARTLESQAGGPGHSNPTAHLAAI